MERISKRYLLHNNKEDEDVKENDVDELKFDINALRIELLSELQKARESLLRYIALLHRGLIILGEHFYKKSDSASHLTEKYELFSSSGQVLREEYGDICNFRIKSHQ